MSQGLAFYPSFVFGLSSFILSLPIILPDVSLLLVYFVPLVVAFSLAAIARVCSISLAAVLKYSCINLLFFSVLHLLASFATYGFPAAFLVRGTCNIFDLFSIYQSYIYYSTLIALCFCINLFFSS